MCWILLGLLAVTIPVSADVYFQPTAYTQELIAHVERGQSQNIQLLIEQGADVNAHIGSSPLFIQAIEDLCQDLQELEENSIKLWVARGLIGLGVAGLVWAGYSHVVSRGVHPDVKRDDPDDLSTDDVPQEPDESKHTDQHNSAPSDAPKPTNTGKPEPLVGAPAQGGKAAPQQEPVAAKAPQTQAAVDDSDDDTPPPPASRLQQPPQPPPVVKGTDKRGNLFPPKPVNKGTSVPTTSQSQPAHTTSNSTASDDVPTSDLPKKKPGFWKRFKHWVSPVKGIHKNSHKQADIAPLYAGAVISGVTIARTATKRKITATQIADRVAVIMALLDIPELDLNEKNVSQETALQVLDRYLGIIKNKQSQETLVSIGNSIRREVDSVLD
jgi:hypothetical protein